MVITCFYSEWLTYNAKLEEMLLILLTYDINYVPNTQCKKAGTFVCDTAAGLEEADPHDLRQSFPRLGQQALLSFPQAAGPQEVTCNKMSHAFMKINYFSLKKDLWKRL